MWCTCLSIRKSVAARASNHGDASRGFAVHDAFSAKCRGIGSNLVPYVAECTSLHVPDLDDGREGRASDCFSVGAACAVAETVDVDALDLDAPDLSTCAML